VWLLASWSVSHAGGARTIELLQGDLSRIPPEHAVDVLVVSAFPDDYTVTATSLVGALASTGVSIARLAEHKKVDLRKEFSCWLSYPMEGHAFRQILCIESGWRGSPPEITDDLFRALAPFLITDMRDNSVAMPLIGTGDQGWPAEQMMESILTAAVSWIGRGLPLRLLKIVVYSPEGAKLALRQFEQTQRLYAANAARRTGATLSDGAREVDVFLSYCHDDSESVQTILAELRRSCPNIRIFYDRASLKPGGSWLFHIAESLDTAKRVAALFTPNYWSSPFCKDEFAAALARQNDTGENILFPIYLRSSPIPYLFRNLQFEDCREDNHVKLIDAARVLAKCFS
jgi:hypothetical protein